METNATIQNLIINEEFIDFYCIMEDKWLQYASWEPKLIAVFGSIENAKREFEKSLE
jgi:hypothetical protein